MQVLSCRCIYKYLRSRVCGDIKPPRYLGPGLRPRPIKTAAGGGGSHTPRWAPPTNPSCCCSACGSIAR